MELYRRTLRAGAVVIVCSLVLRLWSAGGFGMLKRWLQDPDVQSFLIYLETGRSVRFSPSKAETANFDGESPPAQSPAVGDIPVFSAEDAGMVDLYYANSLRPDLETLMEQPLVWDLTGPEPTVLILHTHATESYTKKGEDYQESSRYRTLDEEYNMLSIGDQVARILSMNGITVIHDRELHDYPSYDGSYADARQTIRYYLEKYPTIQLVLDLHRDASGDINNQLRTLCTVEGQPSAQLMLVMGTPASGQSHPDWQENLALGLKLHATLEELAPGIMRPLCLRSQRFNQDLSPGALLIEVGAAGNSHQEALLAAQTLARAIVVLARGSR